MEQIINWILKNYLELFGAITGLIYLYFSIKQKIWLWPLGIISSGTYIFVFFESKFYADMVLQFYYLIISFYGWYHWLHGSKKSNTEKQIPVTTTSYNLALYLAGITILITLPTGYILDNFTDSQLPYWDAATTAASFTATWMLAKKLIEQWLVWVVVDAVCIGLWLYKDLYPTAILFFVYTIMAIVGYFEWKKQLYNKLQPEVIKN